MERTGASVIDGVAAVVIGAVLGHDRVIVLKVVARVAVLLILLTGCAATGGNAAVQGEGSNSAEQTASTGTAGPVATPAVPGLQALAVRLRTDRAIGGQFQTRISNTGSERFTVLGLSLDSPGFERLPFAPRSALYRQGAVIDLPTQYGPVVCSAGVVVDPVFIALQLQRQDGTVSEVRVPVEAPDDIVDRIHREECHAVRLAEAVRVSLGRDFAVDEFDGEPAIRATITLTRGTNTEAIALVGLRGSVVFDLLFADDPEPPPSMAADDDELVVPVVVRNATCESHILGETKQPFLFPFYLTFDGGEQQYGILDVSAEQQDALWAYIQQVCAAA